MNIKVSIIIPVYNVAPFLDACLSSCINQTFRDIEIIVVNDGSRDDSSRVIAAYAAMDNRIRIITKENQGLIYARKSGLDVARGEYVFHLDGDDYIETNAIEELYNKAINSGADYVIAHYYSVYGNNKSEERIGNKLDGLSGQDLLLKMLNRGWGIWGRLICRSLFNDLVYCPVFMGEDLFFNMQITLKVKKAVVVDMCLYNYINHSSSITNQTNEAISWRQNVVMMKSIFYLLGIYSYNQQIRNSVYLIFIPVFIHHMGKNDIEIKTLLYDYYWNKNEVKCFLWREKKWFYLIVKIFFINPYIATMMANIYIKYYFLLNICRSFVYQFEIRYLC